MFSFEFDHNSSTSLYVQLYKYLRTEISCGRIASGERLPSLRSTSDRLDASITTIRLAYDQLLVEGYLISRPNSGYYVSEGAGSAAPRAKEAINSEADGSSGSSDDTYTVSLDCRDPESFDFVKWRKCMVEVLSSAPEALLTEGDRQGEPELRKEIAEYLYKSRGVICGSEQVVISAGTQQLITHLSGILKMMDISLICTEEPGYLPVRNIFRDRGFSISGIPVKDDGIEIEKLPVNIRSAVYVSPQNQYPTGAVMPVSRRHQILEWAEMNGSIIIEDDYDSELRYIGRPIPALQGLDGGSMVVYIGSFSSTLFPSVRISYMVLPASMLGLYDIIRNDYDQTCSKTEQLTLAAFMFKGYYQTNLRKIRKLYSRKLQMVLDSIHQNDPDGDFISAVNTQSGINVILRVNTHGRVIALGSEGEKRASDIRREMAQRIIKKAGAQGIRLMSVDQLDHEGELYIMFRYNQVPAEDIERAVKELLYAARTSLVAGSHSLPSVYEVMRIHSGMPMFLEEHYERLVRSLGSIATAAPFTCGDLAEAISEHEKTLPFAGHGDHNLRVEVDITGHSAMYIIPASYPCEDQYREGIIAGLMQGERRNPNIKMFDHKLREAADKAIKESGCYEVLLVDSSGCITEGSRSNVFFIKGNCLIGPPSDQILPGVTRGKILQIAGGLGAEIKEAPVGTGSLKDYDAAFICGTSPGVLPIAGIHAGIDKDLNSAAVAGKDGKDAAVAPVDISYDTNNALLRQIMKDYDAQLAQIQ